MNFLVTGVGANVGQSICKILSDFDECDMVIGTDIHCKHAGKCLCDELVLLPHCSDKNYLNELSYTVDQNDISFVIPGSEPEIKFFFKNQLDRLSNSQLIIANSLALETCFDKLKTVEFLKKNGFPYPETRIIKNAESATFPSILKSRSGSGSNKLIILKDETDFRYYKEKYPNYILQEYLGNYQEEYTCGLFRSRKGEIRTIIFKREMAGGYSVFGEVIENSEIEKLLLKIASKLTLVGSINIQLRVSSNQPVVFEINPRFSSTVYFRHLMGFQDLIWSVQDNAGEEIGEYKKPKPGSRFYRGDQEYLEFP